MMRPPNSSDRRTKIAEAATSRTERPPDKRTGPEGNGTGYVSLGSTANATVTADILWRLAEQCPADAVRWFGVGYQLGQIDGFGAGWDQGFAGAEHDMEVAWFALACKVRRDAARPTFAELQRRRGKPRAEVHQHALRQSAR